MALNAISFLVENGISKSTHTLNVDTIEHQSCIPRLGIRILGSAPLMFAHGRHTSLHMAQIIVLSWVTVKTSDIMNYWHSNLKILKIPTIRQ